MPNIRPYETQTDIPLNAPSGRAAGAGDFGGYAANALSNLGGTIGQISDEMERRRKEEEEKLKRAEEQAEVSELNVKISKAQEEWSSNLDERLNSAPPGDKTIVPKFTDELDNYFSQLGQDIKTEKGRQYFNEQTANLHTHLLTAAYQGQARLAGVKAKEDFNTALNSSSSALVNDPSSFSVTLQRNNAYINQLVDSGLSSADAAQLRINSTNELAKSAIRGWISLSHQEAKQQLDSGQWNDFIDGQTKVQMYGEIEQAERAERIEIERLQAQADKAKREAEKQTQDAMIQKLEGNELTPQEVLTSNLPPTGEGSKEHFLNVIRARSEENTKPVTTNVDTMLDLYNRIHLPSDSPNKIINENEIDDAYLNKLLTFDDMTKLRKEVEEARTPEGASLGKVRNDFITGISPQLDKSNPLMGVMDASGKQSVYEFNYYVDQKMEEYKKAGKDPYLLFNPDKPDYLGQKNVYSRFMKTMQQSQRDFNESLIRKPDEKNNKSRKPGESIEEYLERINP